SPCIRYLIGWNAKCRRTAGADHRVGRRGLHNSAEVTEFHDHDTITCLKAACSNATCNARTTHKRRAAGTTATTYTASVRCSAATAATVITAATAGYIQATSSA